MKHQPTKQKAIHTVFSIHAWAMVIFLVLLTGSKTNDYLRYEKSQLPISQQTSYPTVKDIANQVSHAVLNSFGRLSYLNEDRYLEGKNINYTGMAKLEYTGALIIFTSFACSLAVVLIFAKEK